MSVLVARAVTCHHMHAIDLGPVPVRPSGARVVTAMQQSHACQDARKADDMHGVEHGAHRQVSVISSLKQRQLQCCASRHITSSVK